MSPRYRGRFAPSPTGPLHAGSLVAALASWLDARAHGGEWLVRIEDVDVPRCVPGADFTILQQLATCGLHPDEPPLWQSRLTTRYERVLQELVGLGRAYPCACSRKDIEAALAALDRTRGRNEELAYPGTCRGGLKGREGRAWRFRVEGGSTAWTDRLAGPQSQDVEAEVGDFVLKRADALFAYQLAVVADDAAQAVTDVVRGMDLADNTPRQVQLQRALHYPTPRYLHTPLVLGDNGEKLSKQNGAKPLDLSDPLAAVRAAARVLRVDGPAGTLQEWLAQAVARWRATMPE